MTKDQITVMRVKLSIIALTSEVILKLYPESDEFVASIREQVGVIADLVNGKIDAKVYLKELDEIMARELANDKPFRLPPLPE